MTMSYEKVVVPLNDRKTNGFMNSDNNKERRQMEQALQENNKFANKRAPADVTGFAEKPDDLPAMEQGHRRLTNGFILGDDDSDDEDMGDVDSLISSDGMSAGVGEANTAMSFVLDEDSGIGMSPSSNSDESEKAERNEQPTELVPLRPMAVRGGLKPRGTRKTKLHFNDFYKMGNDHLGSGAYASVCTAYAISTGKEYAVKLVGKHEKGHTRSRILREVETFKMCKNHPHIVQLIEWFEDEDYFYMVFEKVRGGPLLNHIQRKVCFTEQEASQVTKEIATALKYLHDRGIAHRDIKPENILCMDPERVSPVKICDLDLASKPHVTNRSSRPLPAVHSEPDLASPVGSAEFMAPEVVDTFVGDALKYDKRCDMWSLGVIVYIMLCGYPPFYGECDRQNCGWDQGEPCTDCQDNLFHRIQAGEFDFPEEEWGSISMEAKDLICHLLVKNVRQRYTADDVLKHPWISHGAPKTPLLTANNLFRNDSARDMHQIQEHFNVMNRFNAARLSTRVESSSSGQETPENIPTSPVRENAPPFPRIALKKEDLENHRALSSVSKVDEEATEQHRNAPLEPLHEVQLHQQPPFVANPMELPPSFMPTLEQQQQQPYYQQMAPPQMPPMINMNGMLIFAPPMAPHPNPLMMKYPPMFMGPPPSHQTENGMNGHPPSYERFSQGNAVYNGGQLAQGYYGQPLNNAGLPSGQYGKMAALNGHIRQGMRKSESGGNWHGAMRQPTRAQRSLTPGLYSRQSQRFAGFHGNNGDCDLNVPQRPFTAGPLVYNQKPFHPSLNAAMSQMGLETCQNAMARQDSKDQLHLRQQNSETRVNV
jgi:MAP kinase interacting serine/threonine kinase